MKTRSKHFSISWTLWADIATSCVLSIAQSTHGTTGLYRSQRCAWTDQHKRLGRLSWIALTQLINQARLEREIIWPLSQRSLTFSEAAAGWRLLVPRAPYQLTSLQLRQVLTNQRVRMSQVNRLRETALSVMEIITSATVRTSQRWSRKRDELE
ncbi:hypothetical protein TKK_0013700 [Trichogramma kaykai]